MPHWHPLDQVRWLDGLEEEAAIQLENSLGMKWEEMMALSHLGARARLQRDYPHAERALGEALAGLRIIGFPAQSAYTLWQFGQLAAEQGDLPRAREVLEECATRARMVKSPVWITYVLTELAAVAMRQGDDAQAIKALHE
jgi:hypothetical protein